MDAALSLALSAAWLRLSAYDMLTTLVSGTFLCIPAAVLALLSVLWNVPGSLAIALIVFPHIYRYARNLLAKAYSLPHIITARAKGLGEARILFWHVVPVVAPQLLAVAGVSVSHGRRRGDSCRSSVRIGWSRTTGMASGVGPRSSTSGQHHNPGDTRNLAGQFRGRCNRSYGPRPGIMNLWRKLACVVLVLVIVRIARSELAGSRGIRQAIPRSDRTLLHRARTGSERMKLGATDLPAYSTEPEFLCCWLRPRRCFQR